MAVGTCFGGSRRQLSCSYEPCTNEDNELAMNMKTLGKQITILDKDGLE